MQTRTARPKAITKMIHHPPMRTTAFVLLLVAAGCAVTEINVDVYKGPMANHEDVQTQQLAALAIGAKPILVGLRDQLEPLRFTDEGRLSGRGGDARDAWRKAELDAATHAWDHQRDFMAEPPTKPYGARRWFVNEQAQRVNDILSLFEDRTSAEIGGYVTRASRVVETYRQQWNRFLPGREANQELWELTYRHMVKNSALVKGYHTFILASDNFRDASGIATAVLGAQTVRLQAKKTEYHSANATMALLAEPAEVRRHAELIFKPVGTPSRVKDEFVERVNRIAQGYMEGRAAIDRLFVLTLQMVVDVNQASGVPHAERDRINEAAAELVVGLLGRTYVFIALNRPTPPPPQNDAVSDLRELLEPLMRPYGLAPVPSNSTDDGARKRRLDEAVRLLLVTNPVSGARALLGTHQWFKAADPSSLPGDYAHLLNIDRRFGLTRSTRKDAASSEGDPQNLGGSANFAGLLGSAALAQLQSGIGAVGTLEGGRPVQGIEALSEHHLLASQHLRDAQQSGDSARIDAAQRELRAAREGLVESLIHFAQKVALIANSERLLGGGRSPGPAGAARAPNQATVSAAAATRDRQVDSYIAILQTIGNSIIGAADELHHRGDHQDPIRLKGAADRHLGALRQQVAPDPRQWFGQVRAAVMASTDDLQAWTTTEHDAVKAATTAHAAAVAAADKACGDRAARAARLVELEKAIADQEAIPTSAEVSDAFANAIAPYVDKVKGQADPPRPSVADVGRSVADALADAAATERRAGNVDTQAARDLDARAAYLRSLTALSTAPMDRADAVAEFIRVASDLRRTLDKERVDYRSERTRLETERSRCTQADDIVNPKAQTLNDARQILLAKQVALRESAAGKLDGVRDAILADPNLPPDANAHAVHDALMARLAVDFGAASGDDKTYLAVAHHLVGRVPPPPAVSLPTDATDPRDVLDALIESLKYERMLAARGGGAAGEVRVRELARAIGIAEEYRSDLIYIRPPAAYLRTSNAASILQRGGSDPAWRNLLGDQWVRSVPVLGPGIINGDAADLRNARELDKQFWQNINNVRVAAAGLTNYVIAKDDIGNWYVKNYSGDPEKIIKTAKTLALYGASGDLGTNLIRRNQLDEAAAAQAAEDGDFGDDVIAGPPVVVKSVAQAQRDQLTAQYATQTTAAARDLRALGASLPADVKAAWAADARTKAHVDVLAAVLAADAPAAGALAMPPENADANTDPSLGGKVIEGLRSVREYRAAVGRGIDGLGLNKTEAIRALAATADAAARDVLKTTTDLAAAKDIELSTKDALLAAERALNDFNERVACRAALPPEQTSAELEQQRAEQGRLEEDRTGKQSAYETAQKQRTDLTSTLDSQRTNAESTRAAHTQALAAANAVAAAATQLAGQAINRKLVPLATRRLTDVSAYERAVEVVHTATKPQAITQAK